MTKSKKQYICSDCGAMHSKWSGQCTDCKSWNTIEEEIISASNSKPVLGTVLDVDNLEGEINDTIRIQTPMEELNRVLGGGLVPASAVLIGGDPGIGKSTLLLQLAASLGNNDINCLYITGEESSSQIKLRASRLGLAECPMHLLSATNIDDIIATIESKRKELDVVVIDSIQTMYSTQFSSAPGTISQIRDATHKLVSCAKQNNVALLIVGHVTKEGQIAGPKVLEHMVDTVLYFESNQNDHFRILRSIKNRFGSVNEIGVFEMQGNGLAEVRNPSALFLMDRDTNVSGTAVFAGLEGSRPILVEIQALISPSNMPTPRRSVVGWDPNRLSMILAVLAVRYNLNLSAHEIYLSVAGGLKISEPAADLAVAAAIISAATNQPIADGTVIFGEVGLSGEIRKIRQGDARVKEANKLGFSKAVCPALQQFDESEDLLTIRHIKQLQGLFR